MRRNKKLILLLSARHRVPVTIAALLFVLLGYQNCSQPNVGDVSGGSSAATKSQTAGTSTGNNTGTNTDTGTPILGNDSTPFTPTSSSGPFTGTVTKVSVTSNGALDVQGTNLDTVALAQIATTGAPSTLNIITQTATELLLSAATPFALKAGLVYGLTLSTANAQSSATYNISVQGVTVDSNSNVAIGSATPGAKLHVQGGDMLMDNQRYIRALDSSGKSQSVLIGRWNNNSTYLDTGNAMYFRIKDGAENAVTIDSDKTVNFYGLAIHRAPLFAPGLGNDPGTYVVCWNSSNGQITFAGSCSSSDVRLKKNVRNLDNGLDKILQLRPVAYEWKDASRGKGDQIGFIAQEIEKIYPEVVVNNDTGFKSLKYDLLVAPIAGAIQEFFSKWKSDSKELHQRVAELEKENLEMRQMLCEMQPKAALCHHLRKPAGEK